MMEKNFLNPATNKQWRIEIDGHTIRTCPNGGKVKEILCDSAFQVKSKAASAMMGQMRKGFVYQNPDAAVGQARCHRFVGKDSNGFMPLAAALTRDDFFLTRVGGKKHPDPKGGTAKTMIEKTFLNPATNKQWRIELDGHTIRTCLNGGKVKEILCDSTFQVRSKASSAMMGQMRKGFVYQNPDAAVGQARCHRFVGKDSNGFMPLAAALTRDDFFLTRVVGDFEDEILYHFDGSGEIGSGEILETVSLGAKRMTYEQALCPNDTLLLNNSYLLEQFSLRTHEITTFANRKNSMRTMLDASGDLPLWYTGEDIVVFDFGSNTEVWRETVKCKKSKGPNFAY